MPGRKYYLISYYKRSWLKTSTKSLQGKWTHAACTHFWLVCIHPLLLPFLNYLTQLKDDCVVTTTSDLTPQTAKASCSTVEPDQSIDEILGLQVLIINTTTLLSMSYHRHIADATCNLLCTGRDSYERRRHPRHIGANRVGSGLSGSV